jgi:hypothetical protein
LLLNINIITDYPLWFSIFCVLLGVVYAVVLYRKETKFNELSVWVIRLMAFFRFALISMLAFLLLSPFVKTLFNKVEKPVIIIAQDNSGSILLNKDSAFYKKDYLQQIQKLKEDLSSNYEVKSYTFGDNVQEGSAIDYSQKITDISNLFDEVNNKFYNRNVGALILASDGIFNQGMNPIFNNNKAEFPVYTIALGDTSIQRDLLIKEVNHNKITFLGNEFPIEVYASALQCKGAKTSMMVTHNGKQLVKKEYNITSNQFAIKENLLFEAKEVGVQHYTIRFSTIKGEISTVNNVKHVYIEVLDGRQNILILANAPHPDIKALKLSIESNENYKVISDYFKDFDFNLEPYSLVIVHQISADFSKYTDRLNKADLSALYILGSQTSIDQFNTLKLGLNIGNSRNKFNQVLPSVYNDFPLFSVSEEAKKMLNSSSPLTVPFGTYQLKKNGYVLLNQKIGSVETENPLLVFFQNDNEKVGVLAGEGIWKWRMQEFSKTSNHKSFNEIINKTVQFLSVKEDKSKFRIITENLFLENEEIRFNAELYNDSYELVNDPEINIEILSDDEKKYNFVFSRTSATYILNAGILPVGFYSYKAKVVFGEKEYIEKGQFQINQLLMEANNTVANHQLLQNVAQKFGGELFYPSTMNKISSKIENNEDIAAIIYEEKDLKELINLKWIFFVLLTLLSLEWFLRKRNGAY